MVHVALEFFLQVLDRLISRSRSNGKCRKLWNERVYEVSTVLIQVTHLKTKLIWLICSSSFLYTLEFQRLHFALMSFKTNFQISFWWQLSAALGRVRVPGNILGINFEFFYIWFPRVIHKTILNSTTLCWRLQNSPSLFLWGAYLQCYTSEWKKK